MPINKLILIEQCYLKLTRAIKNIDKHRTLGTAAIKPALKRGAVPECEQTIWCVQLSTIKAKRKSNAILLANRKHRNFPARRNVMPTPPMNASRKTR